MNGWTPGEIATFRADLWRIRKSMRAADVLIDSLMSALQEAIETNGLEPKEDRAKIDQAVAPEYAKAEAKIDAKVRAHRTKRNARRTARRAKAKAAKAGILPPPRLTFLETDNAAAPLPGAAAVDSNEA
jgi:hypothetical protein